MHVEVGVLVGDKDQAKLSWEELADENVRGGATHRRGVRMGKERTYIEIARDPFVSGELFAVRCQSLRYVRTPKKA